MIVTLTQNGGVTINARLDDSPPADERQRRLAMERGRVHTLARLAMVLLAALYASPAAAQSREVKLAGTLTDLRIDNLDDPESPGTLAIGETRVSVPRSVRFELPGDSFTLQELFARAPARCRASRESGLIPSDACRRPPREATKAAERIWRLEADGTPRSTLDPIPTGEPPPTMATVVATRTADGVIARSIALTRSDVSVWGAVTFVNQEEGYLRINGALGADTGGALLRLNDPDGRQSVQNGTGCGEGANCSPDVRFKMNTATATVRFAAGAPACVPGGLGDACSAANRSAATLHEVSVMLPIIAGDHITALGGFEVREGIRVFWAHTLVVQTPPGSD
jgi:hypothetical protein